MSRGSPVPYIPQENRDNDDDDDELPETELEPPATPAHDDEDVQTPTVVEHGSPDAHPIDLNDPLQLLADAASGKRVMPARSRRGGPGVGHCEIDQKILDSMRKAKESKPDIAPETIFRLVTDERVLEGFKKECQSQSGVVPEPKYTSYFQQPEVVEAARQQSLIETPSFRIKPTDAGSKLRQRNGITPTEKFDDSDEAYLARHRKFETHEKRGKRREREQLEHLHHKLKTRIEQLQGLDPPAFGGKDLAESEKLRDEMLQAAQDLEQRYRDTLALEPNRRPGEKRKNTDMTLGDELPHHEYPHAESSRGKVTIRLPATSAAPDMQSEHAAGLQQLPNYPKGPKQKQKKKPTTYKSKKKPPPKGKASQLYQLPYEDSLLNGAMGVEHDAVNGSQASLHMPDREGLNPHPESPGAVDGPNEMVFLDYLTDDKRFERHGSHDLPSHHRGKKSQRPSTPSGPYDGVLLRLAEHSSGSSRQTRNAEPFGFKVPEIFGKNTLYDDWTPASRYKRQMLSMTSTIINESEDMDIDNEDAEPQPPEWSPVNVLETQPEQDAPEVDVAEDTKMPELVLAQ